VDSVNLSVLRRALAWLEQGQGVTLYTVVATWGSSPRPPGSLLALRDDGEVEGSVSGGCVEEDLLAHPVPADPGRACSIITYGVTPEASARAGLPCGGTLKLIREPLTEPGWVRELLERCGRHEQSIRELDLVTGAVCLRPLNGEAAVALQGDRFLAPFGPAWRLLLIGAGQLSRYVAQMAAALDFQVLICDPRPGYTHDWQALGARLLAGMPDDAVRAARPDARTAVVALTHDPVLDDLALIAALHSDAFYVGALGSRANSDRRRARLASLGVEPAQLLRLHGPIGFPIGSRTPSEIALSLMAELVALRNGAGKPQAVEPRHD
jgi:xanthine dehydrogenase accessory factor